RFAGGPRPGAGVVILGVELLEIDAIVGVGEFLAVLHPLMPRRQTVEPPMDEHAEAGFDKPVGVTGGWRGTQHADKPLGSRRSTSDILQEGIPNRYPRPEKGRIWDRLYYNAESLVERIVVSERCVVLRAVGSGICGTGCGGSFAGLFQAHPHVSQVALADL